MKYIVIALAVMLLVSCSSISDFPTIDDPQLELTSIKHQYADELANIHVGDYIDFVAKQFPKMFIASDNMKNTIYEFNYQQQYLLVANNSDQTKTYTQTLRFYFINQKLAHWQVK
ncbi:hypothetical protein ESZ36_13895 [Colwellia demingiae]|uniref:Lipoprotein n=1 Tax=Colwellia demingiae TaxID=89401 RepID=A0A5C6QFM1_9GAMM|nr:hypothetical protein [Colwellia demingiae]TWX67382.1 hypothetical protein ESZ36_13895 [Colwellia demingiae]